VVWRPGVSGNIVGTMVTADAAKPLATGQREGRGNLYAPLLDPIFRLSSSTAPITARTSRDASANVKAADA
jgi:hypothetical protein